MNYLEIFERFRKKAEALYKVRDIAFALQDAYDEGMKKGYSAGVEDARYRQTLDDIYKINQK